MVRRKCRERYREDEGFLAGHLVWQGIGHLGEMMGQKEERSA